MYSNPATYEGVHDYWKMEEAYVTGGAFNHALVHYP
jgi:hypothetical protein